MSTSNRPADRNVDGILEYVRDYVKMREAQAVRVNSRLANIIGDISWVQIENLRQVLGKAKAFGGEKYRVADVLSSADDLKRKALFSMSDQNSIVSEIINRSDEQTKRVADLAIHDMRSLFRTIDPSLENIVLLIQHWMYWDLPDASDLHHFDEQARRLETLRTIELNEDLRSRYRPALGKTVDQPVSEGEVLNMELKRLEHVCARFLLRRQEDEAFQMIIARDEARSREPYDYKKSQAEKLKERLDGEKKLIEERLHPSAAQVAQQEPAMPAASSEVSPEELVL
jgi:hypothetical protein